MKTKIVTTFHAPVFQLYGKNMIETFDQHWSNDVEMHIYYEGEIPRIGSSRIVYHDLLECCPELITFKEDYGHDPIANGKIGVSPHGLIRNDIKTKHKNKESYLWDAVRFSHKVFCQIHAARQHDADHMFWIDADTVTFRDVGDAYKSWIHGDEIFCTFLGRITYTETGFIGFNLNHEYCDEFMNRYERLYTDATIFNLDQWTDCHTFDNIRIQMEDEGKITNVNINHSTKNGHPFVNSVVGDYVDHLKGPRKVDGKSKPKDILNTRGIEYWQRL